MARGWLSGSASSTRWASTLMLSTSGSGFVDAEAVVDGVMVSARAWPEHPAWMRAFLQVLRDQAPVARKQEPATV